MLAVSANLLDRGLDILIVLAGTRIALWRQTYERLLRDLDGTDSTTFRSRKRQRLLVPHPASLLDAENRPGAPTYMAREGTAFRRSLQRGRPVVIVIPKVEDHLLAVSKFLEEHLSEEANKRPVELVVLDDEADDGSVLDADAKKIIPRRIEMLWTGRHTAETLAAQLHATYVAYTATPQANFLQADHNPLSPRDFCTALRAPYKNGSLRSRQVTFKEPVGISRYYCGGEMFYVELADTAGPLVQTQPFPERKDLSDIEHGAKVRSAADALLLDGLRSFLVSGAIRLILHTERGGLTYASIQDGFAPEEADRLPKPHAMLVHPSAKLDLHAQEAWRLVLLSRDLDPDHPDAPVFDHAELRLSPEGLGRQITEDPGPWKAWLEKYSLSHDGLELLPGAEGLVDPSALSWDEVERTLLEQVIPYVALRIINSDPASDDRPRFEPLESDSDRWLPPPDLLTIFVSGNVMSRGITIEGLHSSVFSRPANEPAADTQMQMQRWFGYRGSNAHLCRLFCFEDQLELFRTYHEHDTALRKEILVAMDGQSELSPLTVLTGSRSLATAKIRTTRLPLHPGPSPYVRLIETGPSAEHNARLLNELLHSGKWTSVELGTKTLGRIRQEHISLTEVADLLDQFRYGLHDPDPAYGVQYTRWNSLESQLGIDSPLFRPPGQYPGTPAADVKRCPYSIAAYLRLWAEALKRPRCDGLYATHAERQPWSLVQPTLQPPPFYVGLRYGSSVGNSWEKRGLLEGVRSMKRSAKRDDDGALRMTGAWGSRGKSGGYLGDQLFDYHQHGYPPPTLHAEGPLWRPVGHPGLILFQVVSVEGEAQDAVTVGLALPHGGPEQFAAVPAALKP